MESETQATASPPAVAAVASEAQAQDVSREVAGEASAAAAAPVSAGAGAAAKSESERVEMDTIGDTAAPQAECSTPAEAAAAAQALPPVTAQTPAAEVAPPVRKGDGWAPIKAEFVRSKVEIQTSAEASKPKDAAGAPAEGKGGAPAENQSKKGKRGRNKQRPKDQRPSQGDVLCSHISDGRACTFGQSCRFTHDVKAYLEKKGPDIGNMCPVWDARGTCPSGLKCRFGRAHTDPETLRPIAKPGAADPSTFEHMNALSRDLNFKLRRNQVQFACDRRGWKGFLASLEAEYTRPEPGASPAGEPGGIVAAAAAAAAVAPAAAADAVPAPAAAVVPTVDDTSGKSGGAMSVDGNGEGDGAGEDSRLGPPSSGPPPAKRVRMEGAENGDQTATDGGGGGGGNEPAGASVSEAAAAATAASGEATSAKGAAGAENGAGAEAGGGGVGATGGAEGQGEEEWMRACLEATEPRSRRTIDFEGKVYVAPLTTVGNLPFRRVMKAQGADITCGEMALAHHLLKGNGSEWALLRRHPSEDVFGVQVAGAHPDQMTRAAELLEEHIKVDFVDINMGCPIDLVCDKGMGAALMNRNRKLRGIIAGMTSQLSCPLTVKMRVGWDEKKPNADSVVRTAQREAERSRQRGFPGSVACVMIHGRSRLQRYSKLADWDYVRRVAASQDPSLPPLPVIGNGDILSWRDHEERLEQAKEIERKEGKSYNWSTCCMLARGALIKPWLPTEVKEKRDWDISSCERLDIYRQFVNFGLEHWGSDQMGVNKTRRFLLEWLSFTCRYIPVGILEVLPQRINERPPPYNGRDELEGLMCSLNPADWIKICEMLLGPAPADFEFEPKHKASAYAPLASTTYI